MNTGEISANKNGMGFSSTKLDDTYPLGDNEVSVKGRMMKISANTQPATTGLDTSDMGNMVSCVIASGFVRTLQTSSLSFMHLSFIPFLIPVRNLTQFNFRYFFRAHESIRRQSYILIAEILKALSELIHDG